MILARTSRLSSSPYRAWLKKLGVLATASLVASALALVGTASPVTLAVSGPHLTLTNTPSPTFGKAPLPVTYTYSLVNDGTDTLYHVSVSSDGCGTGVYQSGDTNHDQLLQPGETWVFTCSQTITTPGTYTDTAQAHGSNTQTGLDVTSNQAPGTVTVTSSAFSGGHLTIETTPNPTSGPAPLTVTHTVVLANDGSDPLFGVSVTDSRCSLAYSAGDNNGNGLIDSGEAWYYACTETIATPGDYTDSAHGQATDTVSGVSVSSNTATSTVHVASPGGPPSSTGPHTTLTSMAGAASGPVPLADTFTYTLTNDGTDTLFHNSVTSNSCPAGATYVSGDTNNDTLLQPGETWTFRCSVTLNSTGPYTDVAQGHGTNTQTGLAVDSNTASATVIVNPVVTSAAVTVTKSEPSPGDGVTVTAGQAAPITYGFSAVNSGGTDSGPVTVSDTVPAGTTYFPGSATCPMGLTAGTTPSCTISTGATITWTFSSIPKVTTYSGFGFQVSVNSTASGGTTITNSATFTNTNTPGCDGPTCTTNTVNNPVDTPPTVTSTTPANNATGVLASVHPTITFSAPVTVTNTAFKLECPTAMPVAFTVSPSTPPAAATFTLTPSAALPAGVMCTVTAVASQIADAAGTNLATDFSFSFTVAAAAVPPTVTGTTPANNATGVLASVHPTITFSAPVTVTNTAFKLECPTAMPVAFTVSPSTPPAAATFTLTPSAALPAGVMCTVTAVASQIADAAGTNLATDFSFSFTVDAPPTVTGTTPANGATGVLATVDPTITFNKAVTATNTAFKLECPTGTPVAFTVSPSTPPAAATFILTPSAALPAGVMCTVTAVASQIADAAGTNLATDFSFSFTVGSPPTVTGTTPANGATGVLATVDPTITFNKAVTATNTAFKLECPTGTPVAFTVSPSTPPAAATFTLTPSAALPAGVMCTVTAVASQIADASGTNMATDFSFSFTVDAPPTVTGTTPANGASAVLATVHPTITFNKAVTATATAFKLECPTGTPIAFTASPSTPPAAATFTLTPSAALPAGVMCTVTAVASQITDAAGTNLATDFSYSFTVDTPPTVTGNTPANNATDVPLATTITVTFSKPVSVSTGGFTLECPSGTAQTFTVSPTLPGPGTTFTLTPSAALPSFTTCAVTVVASHVTDAPGTVMVADFGFTFQTAAVPTAVPQNFSGAIGNTTFGVGTTPSQPSTSTTGNVLTGDTNGGAGTLSAVTSGNPITTAHSGSVTMNSDGTFVYQPPAGFVGNDTFTYVVTNGLHTASNTVTISVANRVWYVNSASGTNGNGTSTSPFNVLSSAQSASSANDFIFLYGSATNYTGGITLKAAQTLVGQSVGLVVGGHTVVTASGSNPTITNSGGAGITLAEGDTVNGITVSSPSGAGITASSVNAATIGSSVTVTGSTGDGVDITGGNGTFSVGATITTSSAHSINVQTRTGGTTTFSGPITDTGTGLLLNGNTGATVNFTGTISATTGTHQAFTATAGGTVSATGTGSTLTTTSADALVVSSTTIGSGNLTFRSISSNGATDGISLTSTGTSGGLTVTGNGSAGTGGTIQNSTGAGVYADSAANINLSWMNIANNGSASTNGIGFDNGGDGVKLDNISGTGHLTSSTVTGSNVNNVEIHNNSATLSAFTIQGPSCSVTNNNTTNGDVGIQVLAENTATMTVTVDGCNLSGNRSDAIQGNAASGTASLTMTVTNNTIVAGTGGHNQGNIGIDVVGAAATTLGYTISGNKVGTPDGITDAHLINDGINVFTAGTTSSAVGTITNNIVFGPGAGVSGIPIRVITGTTSTGRSRIEGNTVHGLGFDPGILVQVGQNAGSTAHGDMGVFNNTVDNPPATTGDVGINVETADAGVGCFSVTGNVKGQSGGTFADLNVVAAGTSTFDVAGATLGTISAATVQAYEASHNFQTGPAGVVTAAKATNAAFAGVTSTACNIP